MSDLDPYLMRHCLGAPRHGLLACPNPATRWQVRAESSTASAPSRCVSACADAASVSGVTHGV